MKVKVGSKVQGYIQQARQAPAEIVTEEHLKPLPEPVQRYLRFAQVVGKPKVRCVKVRQAGLMRTTPQQRWLPVEAVQYSTLANVLSRTWYARIRIGPLTLLNGYDCYDKGTGQMLMRLLSMFPVVNVRGPEIDESALIIFINDMVMWPTAFLSDYIHWEPVDAAQARMQVSLHGKQFSATVVINEAGEMADFITDDRYRGVGKSFEKSQWSTPLRKYHEVNGLCIPSQGEAIWHLPEGDFPYIHVTIGNVEHDNFDYE